MVNDEGNEIMNHIRAIELFNKPEDRVKIIYHPEFLSSTSTVLPLDYPDFVRGCHLGVFPSYYEPWGYTPAECAVLGVPSITSNLAGFGSYMEKHLPNPAHQGIHIVDRVSSTWEQSAQQIANILWQFTQL